MCSCILFYVSFYVALYSTDSQRSVSLKVLEVNIVRHITLRMVKFHIIYKKRLQTSKQILRLFGLNSFLQLYLRSAFRLSVIAKYSVPFKGLHYSNYTCMNQFIETKAN